MDVKDIEVICILYHILSDFHRETEIPWEYCPTITEVIDTIRLYNEYHIILVCKTEDVVFMKFVRLIIAQCPQ